MNPIRTREEALLALPLSPSVNQGAQALKSSGSRLVNVQGLRGVAVLAVVCYHAGLPLPGGFVGVDIFFVISGFVITALLIRELQNYGRVRFRRFYIRRVRRLLPALALVLATTQIASMVVQSPLGAQQDTAIVGVGSALWCANIALFFVTGGYFDNSGDSIPLLHMWSLAVEEQFYMLFPALLALGYLMARRTNIRMVRGYTLSVGATICISLVLSLFLSFGHVFPDNAKLVEFAFYSAPTRAWEFGVGALVAIWSSRRNELTPGKARFTAWSGCILLLAGAFLITNRTAYPGTAALVPVIGAGLIIVAGFTPGNRVTRVLSMRPITWLGDVSYSWYLWHWPAIVFTGLLWPGRPSLRVAAAAISLALAWLSYRYVEQPLRISKMGWDFPILRLLIPCIVIPLLLSGVLYEGASRSWGQADVRAMAVQVEKLPMGYALGCHNSSPIPNRHLAKCIFGPNTNKRPIYLVGDSNAGQYAEAVVGAAGFLNRQGVLATMSGCPFVDVKIVEVGFDDSACRKYVVQSTDWFVHQPPSLIIMASANEFINNPSVSLSDPETGQTSNDSARKEAIWSSGLVSTMTTLRRAGHTIILVNVIPHFGTSQRWWTPASCTLLELAADVTRCGRTVPMSTMAQYQARALTAEHQAARASDVLELDLRSKLCSDKACTTNHGNSWIYRDGLHISTRESAALVPEFMNAIVLAERRRSEG